ncbi:MAG TPA: hypothetical protein VHP80_17205, partial [Candidatus Acidoferrum sp.]|nr:hypothetical protein [Candidatus Acidoferrum sp.]
PFTGTAVEVIHRLTGGVPRLINLLSDACLLVGFELKRKQIDQFLVEQASEDVLGLLKGPFAPGGLGTVPASSDSRGRDEAASEEPAPSKWASRPQARAAAAASSDGAGLSSTATATLAAEERRAAKPSQRDANWTKSTFDNLIDALKHGRATARE